MFALLLQQTLWNTVIFCYRLWKIALANGSKKFENFKKIDFLPLSMQKRIQNPIIADFQGLAAALIFDIFGLRRYQKKRNLMATSICKLFFKKIILTVDFQKIT